MVKLEAAKFKRVANFYNASTNGGPEEKGANLFLLGLTEGLLGATFSFFLLYYCAQKCKKKHLPGLMFKYPEGQSE